VLKVTTLVLVLMWTAQGFADNQGATHHSAVSSGDVVQLAPWGTAKQVVRADHMYFAGQPDAAGFAVAAQAGVTTVINLRGPGEVDWDIGQAVQAAGMRYYNVPLVIDDKGINADSVRQIDALVQQLSSETDAQTILLQCGSGNRVAAWWATHLVGQHGLRKRTALKLASSAGLTKPELKALVKTYLK
jgi:uncharacterized protein (TIGR01244 family)